LSFSVGLLAYVFLVGFSIVAWIRRITGKALLLAAVLTFLYVTALTLTGESPLSSSIESLALFAWIVLLLRALGFTPAQAWAQPLAGVSMLAVVSVFLTVAGVLVPWALPYDPSTAHRILAPMLIVQILLCVAGLVAVEQLVRNTREDLRWRLRYLNIGLGLTFVFALIENAISLMFNAIPVPLTMIHPIVLALAVPFIVIASLRNRDTQLRFNVSRQLVFRSGVLIASGTLLLLIGLTGYYVRLTGGDLGIAIVALVITVVGLGIFVVVGSADVQTRIRRFMSTHLYDASHDYRDQWARVTRQLTEPNPDFTLEQQAIRSVLGVFDAPAGAYWHFNGKAFTMQASLHADWNQPLDPAASAALVAHFTTDEQLIDLDAPPAALETATAITRDLGSCRFLVPLFTHQGLLGMIGVCNPNVSREVTEEDVNLVQLVSREAAGFLALRAADQQLSETRQFDTVNRLTTYLIHDVKTITAQLSLLVENAAQHKSNPAFIDDMLETIANAVDRMKKLTVQLQESRSEEVEEIDLGSLLAQVVAQFSTAAPSPEIVSPSAKMSVRANRERLASAIGHILQNGIDASPENGSVVVKAVSNPPWVDLTITDSGSGMSQEFIETELFTPFRSTKGVTGMGIGAYQVREYVRSLGGDVHVRSCVGEGSCFTLKLPMVAYG
jgi:putative PEP-CTERM system histidine kinase